jgi:adenosylcobinamide-phosphate synthase
VKKTFFNVSVLYAIGVLAIAWIVDRCGEPPLRLHPVVWYGRLIQRLQRQAPQGERAQFYFGVSRLWLATLIVLPPIVFVDRMIAVLRKNRSDYSYVSVMRWLLAMLIEGVCLKPFLALHLLVDAGKDVRMRLQEGELEAARRALRSLVSRERARLSEELIIAATVESLGENLSDSAVAPLFYYALFGLPGAALYRLYNTFDAMVGYHGRYEYVGKAAARWDDVLNVLPSRLTSLMIIVCAPLFGGNGRRARSTWRRDARKTESPNAGQPMAALAGALGVQLKKVDHYVLGDAIYPLAPSTIRQAERITFFIGSCMFVLTACYKGYQMMRRQL